MNGSKCLRCGGGNLVDFESNIEPESDFNKLTFVVDPFIDEEDWNMWQVTPDTMELLFEVNAHYSRNIKFWIKNMGCIDCGFIIKEID